MHRTRCERRHGVGFTLVELTVSIALIGLLAMAAVPLLRVPLEGWMDATRRSTLTTELDLVHTKLRDDMARALPGSVRVRTVGGRQLLEFLEVRASGTYRAVPPASGQPKCPTTCGGNGNGNGNNGNGNGNNGNGNGGGNNGNGNGNGGGGGVVANDALDSSCADTCFVNLSPWDNGLPALAATDWVVVNPTGVAGPYSNGANRVRTQALAVRADGRVDIAAHRFTPLSPSPQRFYIVTGPVTYECNTATRRLTRYWNYGIANAQPANFNGAASATLSSRVQGCALRHERDAGLSGRGGIVNTWFRLSNAVTEPNSPESADLQASFSVSEEP
ncbi:MAG: type II secretion system protein [Pseudomonadota bacterium]